MSRTVGKAVHTVKDMWAVYARKLLQEDPKRYGRREKYMTNYSIYIDVNGVRTTIMTYGKFRKLIEHYFDKAKREIIAGNAINITHGVGKIAVKRVERDFRNKNHLKIDYQKTSKQPKVERDGVMKPEKIIYHTEPDWCRIAWFKSKNMTNIAYYEFIPTSPNSNRTLGFKLELIEALNNNPLLRYKYLYQPVRLKT